MNYFYLEWLLKDIIFSKDYCYCYLKPYNYVQTNYYEIELVTWNHIIMNKLLLDWNA